MDVIQDLIQAISWDVIIGTSVRVLLILILGFALMSALRLVLGKLETRLIAQSKNSGETPGEATKRVETLIRLVRQGIRGVLWLTILLVVLKEIGVDVAPILASAGVVGLAVGFGAQNLVRDVISGFFFIMENQVRVGDVAIVNGTGGLVERMNFRTITLRDLGGAVHVFPNGTVNTLSNLTRDWSAYLMDIGVAYKEDPDHVIEIMRRVGAELREDPVLGRHMLGDIEVFGVDKFGDSGKVPGAGKIDLQIMQTPGKLLPAGFVELPGRHKPLQCRLDRGDKGIPTFLTASHADQAAVGMQQFIPAQIVQRRKQLHRS